MTDPSSRSERTLLLCFHNHQPVGNFDFVIEEATRNSYLPFLKVLAEFPEVRVTLHYTGFLLRWLLDHSPETVGLLREMVARGQVEVLGGGMYEPILALLPERDRQGQLRELSALVAERFGEAPEGIWLAERVWEPGMVPSLAAAGVKYLPLDDYHFLRAGLTAEELDGVYLTESDGASVRIFPGSERLRYLIPFGGVDEALDTIERMTARDVPWPAAIFADDGEKFGVWPGTYRSVYEEGWLARFLSGIRARAGRFTTMTFSEYARRAPVRGRVYLPTASYVEMGEWALPARQAARFDELLRAFREGRNTDLKPFAQGGFYRNFLRKYEEANQLHKRMWQVSGRVEAAGRKAPVDEAADALYRAQSNDVYWHGVFGGLYLNHLRESAYTHLLRAERLSDRVLHGRDDGWTESFRGDLDLDGGEEVLLKTPEVTLLAHPHDGGAITEISFPKREVAVGHVLTRREEAYHAKFRNASGSFDGSTSIHDAVVLKDPSVLQALAVDPWQRASLRESFYRDTDPDDAILYDATVPLCVSAGCAADARVEGGDGRIALAQEVAMSGGPAIVVEKRVELAAGEEGFRVAYRFVNRGGGAVSGKMALEWNMNFLSGIGPDRRIEGAGDDRELSSRAVAGPLRSFRIVDAWRRFAISAESDRDFSLLRYPIETASLSESGAEKIHQGVSLRLLFFLQMPAGKAEGLSLRWRVSPA